MTTKNKRGRPRLDARGVVQTVGIRLGPTHRALLNKLRKRRKSSRSAVVRDALEEFARTA